MVEGSRNGEAKDIGGLKTFFEIPTSNTNGIKMNESIGFAHGDRIKEREKKRKSNSRGRSRFI